MGRQTINVDLFEKTELRGDGMATNLRVLAATVADVLAAEGLAKSARMRAAM